MNLDLEKNKFHALNDWFSTPQGLFIQEEIHSQILSVSERLRGTTVLQLGLCGGNIWLEDLPFRHQWLLSPYHGSRHASLISSTGTLSLDRASVDCVIAPFVMELNAPDKRFIYEIDRILKPMGHVIFIGVNPFSLWGLFLKLGFIAPFKDFRMTLTSSLILKQLMLSQGYFLNRLRTFCYVPPVRSTQALSCLRFLNEMGKMVILSPAGFYCLVVQKYQYAKPKFVAQKRKPQIKIQQPAAGLARVLPENPF